jgi:alpha-tubulin suppressor-like RCC1 family protein
MLKTTSTFTCLLLLTVSCTSSPKSPEKDETGSRDTDYIPDTATTPDTVDSGDSDTKLDTGTLDTGSYRIENVSTESGWISVLAGEVHSCGLRDDGSIICWGCEDVDPYDDDYGYDQGQCTPPEEISFKSLSEVWDDTSCGVDENDALHCWGLLGTIQFKSDGSSSIVDSSAEDSYACVLNSSNELECVGDFPEIPKEVSEAGSSDISVSSGYICSILTSGDLSCWNSHKPEGMFNKLTSTYTSISAGSYHACGIVSDGSLQCWSNDIDEDYGEATPPKGTFQQISVGNDFSCALSTKGHLSCWGRNDVGQSTPPSGIFTQVAAGWWHACAVRDDGHLVCWGGNASDQASVP